MGVFLLGILSDKHKQPSPTGAEEGEREKGDRFFRILEIDFGL